MARTGINTATDGPAVVPVVAHAILQPSFPNPFNPRTSLRFILPARHDEVSLRVFDMRGKMVRDLSSSVVIADGVGRSEWNGMDGQGREVSSGSYLAVLRVNGERVAQKLTLVR